MSDDAETPDTPPNQAEAAPAPAPEGGGSLVKKIGLVLLLAALITGGILTIKHTRHYIFPKRFYEIEPGVYRAGQMELGPYRGVVEDYGIQTVMRLNSRDKGGPLLNGEEDLLQEQGVRLVEFDMPGDGLAKYSDLDRAADMVEEELTAGRPVLFHCWGGMKRSSAVHAAWRLKHGGWTYDKVARELGSYGLRSSSPELYEHIEGYSEYLQGPAQQGAGETD